MSITVNKKSPRFLRGDFLFMQKSPFGDLKLVETGGEMSNFYVEDLEKFGAII